MKTIEQQTAETILQKDGSIKIGRRTFRNPKPTSAALIEASAIVSTLPRIVTNQDEPFVETMRIAKDCVHVADAVAVLLTGAKRSQCGFALCRKLYEWRKARVRRILLECLTPAQLQQLAIHLFRQSEAAHFFDLTTFLIGINMLKPTVKVEEETTTTAFGQQ